MVAQSTKSQIIYTTIRISKDFHTWIFGKGKKGESYDDVLQRISGYKTGEPIQPDGEPIQPDTPVDPNTPDTRVMYAE